MSPKHIALSLVAASSLLFASQSQALVIDTFDTGAQSSEPGVNSTQFNIGTLGGVRFLQSVNTNASVSGTAPGVMSATGLSSTRVDLGYGTAIRDQFNNPAGGEFNADLSGHGGILFEFSNLTGDLSINSVQLYGTGSIDELFTTGVDNRWIQQTALNVQAGSTSAFLEFSLFAPQATADQNLASFMADVDGMLIFMTTSQAIDFELTQVSFSVDGTPVASSASVPAPTTPLLAIAGLGMLMMRQRAVK